jgi:hypothetical protein
VNENRLTKFAPQYLILHDYGGTPQGEQPFNPYHALVSGGRVIYRDPANPYGAPAPHAYQLNPYSVGLSWGGNVGGTPGPADMDLIRAEVAKIKQQFPDIKVMSHGEAYRARTKGLPQASRLGRGLDEASWRTQLEAGAPQPVQAPAPTLVREGATPMAQRSLTFGHPAAKPQEVTLDPITVATASNRPAASAARPQMVAQPQGRQDFYAPGADAYTGGQTPWAQAMQQQMASGTPALPGTLEGGGRNRLLDLLSGWF